MPCSNLAWGLQKDLPAFLLIVCFPSARRKTQKAEWSCDGLRDAIAGIVEEETGCDTCKEQSSLLWSCIVTSKSALYSEHS